ncbi:MAG: ParB/RepB/Spo0J family partition protein [Pseudomonadota bacterium]|nr:ParB/RepB/Spo0J family partition protein [Pseudomonadota bacterium]
MAKKRGLGRGLDALLGIESNQSGAGASSNLSDIPIEHIETGRYQPRKVISEEKLQELASSIRLRGVVQPVVVRPSKVGHFELVAGERRWRAAKIAGLKNIPAIIKEVTDEEAMSIGLIENIQREQLGVMEEALALDRLAREFKLTHQEIAEAVGRSRASVSNLIRLLDLSPEVREILEAGKLEMGHARALLGVKNDFQLSIATEILEKELSVRQTEALIKRVKLKGNGRSKSGTSKIDSDVSSLEKNLSEKLGSDIKVKWNKQGKGALIINFRSLDELDGIIRRLK